MAERWYFVNAAAPYTPSTWEGGWDSTPSASAYTCMLDPVKWALAGQSSVAMDFTGTGPHAVAARRLVSRKLAAQTLSGTVNMVAGLLENDAAANFYTKLYLWVTVGDSSTVRGVLLDYAESSGGGGTEWPTARTGRTLQATQALTPVAVQEGDRLVVEIGATSAAGVSSTYTASVEVGAWGFSGAAYSALAAAETPTTDRVGYLEFSAAIALSSSEPTNLSPSTATAISSLPSTIVQTPTFQSQELWFAYAPAADTPITAFAGRSVGGTYEPVLYVWRGPIDASFEPFLPSVYGVADCPYVLKAPGGITTYLQAYPVGAGAISGTLTLVNKAVPVASGNLNGSLLITPDETAIDDEDQLAYVVNATTGSVTGVVMGITPSENGAFIPSAQRWLNADEHSLADLVLFDAVTLAQVARLTGVISASVQSGNTPIAASADTFYVAQYRADLSGTPVRLLAIGTDGTPGTTWDLTPPSGNQIWGLGVTSDNTIAYYARNDVNQPVLAWDLVNDVALPDLVAGQATYTTSDLMVLADGSVLVQWRAQVSGGAAYVARYSAAGALLDTYDPQTDSGVADGLVDHIRQGTDDPVSFWVWVHDQSGVFAYSHFLQYDVETGAVLQHLQGPLMQYGLLGTAVAPGDLPAFDYAPPDSCPLLLVSNDNQPPIPGYGLRTILTRRLRRAPHLSDEQKLIFYSQLQIDLQAGMGLASGQGSNPLMMLRYSDDGGHTWSDVITVSAGRMGQYKARAIFRRLGRSRDRVFEVSVSDPIAWLLVDAYLELEKGIS